MRQRTPISIISSLALTLLAASPVAAGDEGTVTFRLTIRGAPIATDSFTLAVNADTGTIISPGVRCGPGSELYNETHVACAPRDYDFSVELPVGTELTYTYARYVDYLASGGASGAQRLLQGSIAVASYPQTVTLVYDYSLGALPDTSAEPSEDVTWVPIGVTLVGGSVLVIRRRFTHRGGEIRKSA
jgi:hypothetical protein